VEKPDASTRCELFATRCVGLHLLVPKLLERLANEMSNFQTRARRIRQQRRAICAMHNGRSEMSGRRRRRILVVSFNRPTGFEMFGRIEGDVGESFCNLLWLWSSSRISSSSGRRSVYRLAGFVSNDSIDLTRFCVMPDRSSSLGAHRLLWFRLEETLAVAVGLLSGCCPNKLT